MFPELLMYTMIKRLYRKGNKTNPSNYRPTSLLTCFSKVFEKALYIKLTEHINNSNILVGLQFGFRKKLAREDAVFKLIHAILSVLINRVMVGSIYRIGDSF
jgi:hypothetical protein